MTNYKESIINAADYPPFYRRTDNGDVDIKKTCQCDGSLIKRREEWGHDGQKATLFVTISCSVCGKEYDI